MIQLRIVWRLRLVFIYIESHLFYQTFWYSDMDSFMGINIIWLTFCRNIILYPKGHGETKGKNISIYVTYAQSSALPYTKLLVKVILRVKYQKNIKDFKRYSNCYLSSLISQRKNTLFSLLENCSLPLTSLCSDFLLGFSSFPDELLFSPSKTIWGYSTFMSLAKLKDPKEGYLADDSLIMMHNLYYLNCIYKNMNT